MLTKRVPLYTVIVSFVFSGALAFFAFTLIAAKNQDSSSEPNTTASYCSYNISRLGGYEFVRPLLFAEPECESPELTPVKNEIEAVVNSYKASGAITSASVFLREFHKGEWVSINEDEKYSPGSLLKVPELMTFIKMNERQPGLLEKKILFDKPITSYKTATYLSKGIKLGQTYTIRELLYYMIAYSDNNATLILNKFIDIPTFKKIFTDVGLPAPDFNAKEYLISARDYSLFMKELYNATYLTIENSEYCTEMMSHSDFKEGLIAGLPQGCKVVHKFGEGGYSNTPNFSESGIIYCNNTPYILTVMLKGTDMRKMPPVIGNISKVVYDKMSGK